MAYRVIPLLLLALCLPASASYFGVVGSVRFTVNVYENN